MLANRLIIVVCGVVLSGVLSSCTSRRPDSSASVPRPLAIDSDQVLAYVAVPSLDGLLRDVIAFADVIQPGALNEQMMTAQIGAMVGDPELSTVHRDKPIALLVLKGTTAGSPVPPIVGFLPVKDGSPIEQSVSGLGMQAKRSGRALLVAQTGEALAAAEKVGGFYEKIASAGVQETAVLYVHTGRVMDAYRTMLDAHVAALSGMDEMFGAPVQPGGMSIATILKMELKGLLAFLSQCSETQIAIDVGRDGATLDQVLVAKAGSSMAKFFSGSGRQSRRAPAYGSRAGEYAAGSFSIDAGALGTLAEEIVRELAKDPELGALLKPELTDMWTRVGEWWTGTADYRYGTSDKGLSYTGVMGVSDEARFNDLMRRAAGMFKSGGTLHELYQAMGLDLSAAIEETTRTHSGVSVREWTTSWNTGALDAQTAELIQFMPRAWSLAVVDGNGLLSTDSEGLDRMIDDAKAGREASPSLEAERVFGGGRQGYMDLDFLEMAKSMAGTMGGPDPEALDALLQNAPAPSPVCMAASFEDDRMRFQTRVPSALARTFAMIGSAASEPGLPAETETEE